MLSHPLKASRKARSEKKTDSINIYSIDIGARIIKIL
jgi:hypothetical protein